MEWCVERALPYFDAGDKTGALASFLSDVGKHPGTQHIQSNPATLMIMRIGVEGSRDEFEKAMRGFAIFD